MRLLFLLLGMVSIAASLECYVGIVRWGDSPKEVKLRNCNEQCCMVTWSAPGTKYSCGTGCPNPRQFVNGIKCEQAPTDASWCFCTGPFGQCKPTKQ